MFGDKTIEVKNSISIINNKIELPKETNAEIGETVYSMIDIYQRKITLMNEQEFYQRLSEYKEKLDELRKNGKIDYKTYHHLQTYIWGILCLHERTITKKREYMLFSKKFEDQAEQRQIRKLNFINQVYAVGQGTTLELYPSEQAYKDYLLFREEKKLK